MKRKKLSSLQIYLLDTRTIKCRDATDSPKGEDAVGICDSDFDPKTRIYSAYINVCDGGFSSDSEDTLLHELIHYLQFMYHKPITHSMLFKKLHKFLTANLLDKEIKRPL